MGSFQLWLHLHCCLYLGLGLHLFMYTPSISLLFKALKQNEIYQKIYARNLLIMFRIHITLREYLVLSILSPLSLYDCLYQVLTSARKEVVIVTKTLTAWDLWQVVVVVVCTTWQVFVCMSKLLVFVDMSKHFVFVDFSQHLVFVNLGKHLAVYKHRCCMGHLASIYNLVLKQVFGRYVQ